MKLGLNLGYWGAGNDADNLALAKEADDLGYAVAWVAEAYGSDAPTVLAFVAAQTSRIDIGSAIFQIPGRTPANCAMTAATLDTLSGGRFRLGLGVSGPQVSEGWHGVRFDKPLARTREYSDIVKLALSRQKVRYDGQHYVLPLPDGPGKALQLTVHPVREHIPMYLAAVGPKNLELSGELFDGWLAIFYSPDFAKEQLAQIEAGRAKVGKTLEGFDVVPTMPIVVGDDPRACADPVRWYAALYVGGMGSREKNFYNQLASPHGLRRGRGEGPGPLPRPRVRRGRRRRAVRVPRPDRAARPEGAHRREDAGARRLRRHDADAVAVRRLDRGEEGDAAHRRRGARAVPASAADRAAAPALRAVARASSRASPRSSRSARPRSSSCCRGCSAGSSRPTGRPSPPGCTPARASASPGRCGATCSRLDRRTLALRRRRHRPGRRWPGCSPRTRSRSGSAGRRSWRRCWPRPGRCSGGPTRAAAPARGRRRARRRTPGSRRSRPSCRACPGPGATLTALRARRGRARGGRSASRC